MSVVDTASTVNNDDIKDDTEDNGYQYSEAEKIIIARVVYAESRGECFEGQVAVAQTVINRFESGKFGKTVKRVATTPNQFAYSRKWNKQNMKAVEEAILKRPHPKNMFYFQRSKSKRWRNFKYYKRIGNHSFYLSSD